MYKHIILSLSLISLINCKAQKELKNQETAQNSTDVQTETSMKSEGNIIYFSEGENKFLKEFQMNVTFKSMAEDSRCPQGTQCIWAGVAVANVEVMSTTSRPMTLQFSTTEVNGKDYHTTQSFNGYKISLVKVTPYPTAENGAKSLSGKYKIGISVTKEVYETNSTMK
ncbi:hypothetical protein OF897_16125 [Chryseobacterium formosus]|uniref:Lipoprotein n=1 Tax=Chryseobacterium formosus TaxID=1537363 RepID=A0ABT3XUZ4_9FLAO|nr:hypothetical protein [Chryseobacterium formosus]MCX8525443.1 hypothetical protein [Chryseobacterium formosus]